MDRCNPPDEQTRHVEEHYKNGSEELRLKTRHGQVEYLTTMKYIQEYLPKNKRPTVLEVGAGAGAYSAALAKMDCIVTAVDLVQDNLMLLAEKLDGTEDIVAFKGDARNLSFLMDETYDMTLILGPMYHLFTKQDQLKALNEAVRVTRPRGYIFAAYCMNDATIMQYVFREKYWNGYKMPEMSPDHETLAPGWKSISDPKEVFNVVRTEDIDELDTALPVERIRFVATDGFAGYNKTFMDAMSDEMFEKWMDYHYTVCERSDMTGLSNHTLDILRKL